MHAVAAAAGGRYLAIDIQRNVNGADAGSPHLVASVRLLAVARYLLTAVVTGLAAVSAYFPAQHWIPVVISVLAALGIHVMPTSKQ